MAAKIVHSRAIVDALISSGIVPDNCKRIIIDLPAEGPGLIYYTLIGDERLLEVMQQVAPLIQET